MKTEAVMCMALTSTRPFAHPAAADEFLNLRSDVDKSAPSRDLEPKVFRK